jgi:glycine/D-amino acid oxidase-like deaminating enzyme
VSTDYRELSFWHDTLPGSLEPRARLESDLDVDVAIVGAGYTGLWTAYYLARHQPDLRIAIVEAEIAGYGASGRNGGWCVGAIAGISGHEPEGGARLQRAMFDTVAEVGDVVERESIDCHWAHGGVVMIASSAPQREHLLEETAYYRAQGFDESDVRWLPPTDSATLLGARRNLGGMFIPHCAALHPARLVRGLAAAVERAGVALFELSPAIALEPGRVRTAGGSLRADLVVRATEAYTRSLPGHERTLLPLHSMMIATEPLPEPVWKEIGLPGRETFGDPRRTVIYGQRTQDDRIAFGCRGAYYYGSQIHDRFPDDHPSFRVVESTLHDLLPVLRDFSVTHRWGGALGVPRDWRPSVGVDRETGVAWAGGYVGEGVAASNLAGRTLADLILERQSELVTLPLVGPPFPEWEPEPLRWIGARAVSAIGASLDEAELAGRPGSKLRGAIFDALVLK